MKNEKHTHMPIDWRCKLINSVCVNDLIIRTLILSKCDAAEEF